MILPKPSDAIHKVWLYRLLSAIADDGVLASALHFKGGTCAAMRGWLDRFSVDLDFDLDTKNNETAAVRKKLERIFRKLGLEIKDASRVTPQYFLKYPAKDGDRNTLKIDITDNPPKSNAYELVRLAEIDRIMSCQTIETMFANKLVALIDRFEKSKTVAGRDVYDIHHFFLNGCRFNPLVIEERKRTTAREFFGALVAFMQTHVNQTVIDQDLNVLLPSERFKQIRKILKSETLMFLKDELGRMSG